MLDFLRRHRVEAVFTARVHNFFYNGDDTTEFYVAPATSAARHDYSKHFSIAPADEFGRNDLGKPGYFWVEVHDRGHVTHYVRTSGSTAEIADAVRAPLHGKLMPDSRLGLDLRHAWAQPVAVPITGALDEFGRKWVRNDYALAAIREMGVGRLRVPVDDVVSSEARDRMWLLRRSGIRFTVFMFDLPTGSMVDHLGDDGDCNHRLEITLQGFATSGCTRCFAELAWEARQTDLSVEAQNAHR